MQKRVMIVGHSHARRLHDFISCEEDALVQHNFRVAGVEMKIIGFGGMKVSQLPSPKVFREIAAFQPQAIIFMIGDNDIQQTGNETPTDLADRIVTTCTDLADSFDIPEFYVHQLLPRVQAREANNQYDTFAREVNTHLLHTIKNLPGVRFVQHNFLAFRCENVERFDRLPQLFLHDGVHLNNRGYRRLYKGLRGTVIYSAKLHNLEGQYPAVK